MLCTLVLIEPKFTVSAPASAYTTPQLLFVALSSLALWLVFVFMQTMRHRDYFLPLESPEDESTHAAPPSAREAWTSLGLLLACLIAVVGLAKSLSPSIEQAIMERNAPIAMVGVLIAMIVLNLAIGSAMACIGLTVPVVVAATVALDLPLTLGLEPTQIALLALTFIVGAITLGSGRTNVMQGAIHLIVFAAFLFLTLVP